MRNSRHYDAVRRLTYKPNEMSKHADYFTYNTNGLLQSPGGIASLAASPSLGRVMLQNRFASQPGWPYFTASGSLNFTRDTSGLINALTGDKQLGATYDSDLQISSITHILPQPFAESYTYDDNGNRLTSLTNSFIYDDLNRLTESTTHEYTYDADGNMTQEKNKLTTETKKYYYDSENRMIKYEHLASDISPIDITATYKYDIFGRRLQKNVNNSITNFFWENDTMTYELNEQYQPIRKYLTGVGIDNYEGHLEYSEITDWPHIFWPEYNQPWYSYMKDQVGTIYKVHSLKTRSITDSRAYDSFGNLVNQTGTTRTPLGFQGKYFDAESGLNYFYHRYYNPAIGRFMTEDPIGFDGGNNFFNLSINNPTNFIDPFGLRLQIYACNDFKYLSRFRFPLYSYVEDTNTGNWYELYKYTYSPRYPGKGNPGENSFILRDPKSGGTVLYDWDEDIHTILPLAPIDLGDSKIYFSTDDWLDRKVLTGIDPRCKPKNNCK